MGIRIQMENRIDDIERRLFMLEGAMEDLLEIYKENNANDKKEKLSGEQSKKKKATPKKETTKSK